MDPVRSAIVGGGFIGRVHARAVLAGGARLRGIIDVTPEASRTLSADFGVENGLETFEEVLADPDVDLVHICTPNNLHAKMAHAVIAAGKHVICEKPLATTAVEAKSLLDAANAAGVLTGVPFAYRFYASVRDARARVAAGEIGALRMLHGHYLQDWLLEESDNNWRVDPAQGGASRAFGDIGVHWCDLIEFVSGEKIANIMAKTVTAQKRVDENGERVEVATEDLVTFMFETENSVIGTAVVSQVSAGRANELLLNLDGSKAALSFNQMLPDSLWIGQRDKNSIVWRNSSAMQASAADYAFIPSGHPQGYQDSFNAFYRDMTRTIRGIAVDGMPTFADGERAARITEAVLASAKSNSWTEVST